MDGDETFMAHAGAFITIPKGALHRFKNVGTQTAKMLILFTPGGVEGFPSPSAYRRHLVPRRPLPMSGEGAVSHDRPAIRAGSAA